MARTKIFITYSHDDENWRKRIVQQLDILQRVGLVDLWDDRKVLAGEDWLPRLRQEMLSARIAVLLVSSSLLTSTFILEEEVPRLFERHERDGMTIYPLLIRACPWREVPWLARMQLRPADAKPLSRFRGPRIEQALSEVASEIAEITRNSHPSASSATRGAERGAPNATPAKDAARSAVAPSAATPAAVAAGGPRAFAYCRYCGVIAGNAPTTCIDGRNHGFVDGKTGAFIYCRYCGVFPVNAPTRCIDGGNHGFNDPKAAAIVYCQYCGMLPGNAPTTCIDGGNHGFNDGKAGAFVYCRYCGMLPGSTPTTCTDGRNHGFAVRETDDA